MSMLTTLIYLVSSLVHEVLVCAALASLTAIKVVKIAKYRGGRPELRSIFLST